MRGARGLRSKWGHLYEERTNEHRECATNERSEHTMMGGIYTLQMAPNGTKKGGLRGSSQSLGNVLQQHFGLKRPPVHRLRLRSSLVTTCLSVFLHRPTAFRAEVCLEVPIWLMTGRCSTRILVREVGVLALPPHLLPRAQVRCG